MIKFLPKLQICIIITPQKNDAQKKAHRPVPRPMRITSAKKTKLILQTPLQNTAVLPTAARAAVRRPSASHQAQALRPGQN